MLPFLGVPVFWRDGFHPGHTPDPGLRPPMGEIFNGRMPSRNPHGFLNPFSDPF